MPINSGEMTSTTCSVSKGDLPLNITWFFNNRPMSTVEDVTVSLVNTRLSALSIESVHADHAGNYTCIAANRAGTTSYSTTLNVNGNFNRKFQYLPKSYPSISVRNPSIRARWLRSRVPFTKGICPLRLGGFGIIELWRMMWRGLLY